MAVKTIAHKPSLTKEQVQEIFAKHFTGKYSIEKTHAMRRDFMVVKNAFVAVAVRLEQTGSETKLVYNGYTPRIWSRLLLGGLIGMLLWNSLTNEVEAFIDSAPEFK
jgi:hypothetical protein